jgi:hypothetical protein
MTAWAGWRAHFSLKAKDVDTRKRPFHQLLATPF